MHGLINHFLAWYPDASDRPFGSTGGWWDNPSGDTSGGIVQTTKDFIEGLKQALINLTSFIENITGTIPPVVKDMILMLFAFVLAFITLKIFITIVKAIL